LARLRVWLVKAQPPAMNKSLLLERFLTPFNLFLIVNASIFAVFCLTPSSYFMNQLGISKGDPLWSFLILANFAFLFVLGTILALILPKTNTYLEMNSKRLAFCATMLFWVSFLGFISTIFTSGVRPSNFVVGQFNLLRDQFYQSYNIFTPFRIFFLSGWMIIFFLIREKKKISLFAIGLGSLDLIINFVFNSSRLSILLLTGGFIVLILGRSKLNLLLISRVFVTVIALVFVFAFGAFLRDAGTAAGQTSSLLRNYVGYFATPYSYLAFVPNACHPQFAPQQLFFYPILQFLPEKIANQWNINDISVCRTENFYAPEFNVLSLPAELFVGSGSWVLVGIYFVFYGFITNVFYRLFRTGNRFGLMVYPLLSATLLDSYRLPLMMTNVVFGNLVALTVVAILCDSRLRFWPRV
jgi:oligosaccharide repeat unit polymerase